MDWQEIVVRTSAEASESVADIMQELGSGGVVIEDPAVVKFHLENSNWDYHELPEELLALRDVLIKCYFPIDDRLPETLEEIKLRLNVLNREIMPGSIINIELDQLAEEDWAHAWKAYYKPVKVGEKIVIKPSWEDYQPVDGEIIVELDPGMAFGTGTHATTTMCIEALQKVIAGGELVYDVGTGSGVLSVVAAKLGAREVKSIDIDPVAVKVASENVAKNDVTDKVTVFVGNLLDMAEVQAQVVVANIIATVIIDLSPAVRRVLVPGGLFIASGIIKDRWPEVQSSLIANGFKLQQVQREKEWIAVIAEKGE